MKKIVSLLPKTTRWLTQFTGQLLPPSCFLCGNTTNQPICAHCLADLPGQVTRCPHCAKALSQIKVCDECQQQLPPYLHTQVAFSYLYPIDKLISAAKFHQNLVILHLLGQLMAQRLIIKPRPQVLIPVPLHLHRLRQRGYNQSLELAKCIAKQTGIPIAYQASKKVKNTPPQTTLSGRQRKLNVKGAFKVIKIAPDWQHVVLIDDVMTTGATVNELALVFKQAGISRVDIWCCARR